MMQSLQKLGKALMGAVAVMPVAAILMGIGYWIDPDGWGANNIVAAVLIKAGGAVLDNLGWLFAIAIAFGLAKDSNGAAALSGFIGYGTIKLILSEGTVAVFKGVDLEKLEGDAAVQWASQGWGAINDKNVLIGILVGILAAWVYNRFHTTKLPDFLAFFSGRDPHFALRDRSCCDSLLPLAAGLPRTVQLRSVDRIDGCSWRRPLRLR